MVAAKRRSERELDRWKISERSAAEYTQPAVAKERIPAHLNRSLLSVSATWLLL